VEIIQGQIELVVPAGDGLKTGRPRQPAPLRHPEPVGAAGITVPGCKIDMADLLQVGPHLGGHPCQGAGIALLIIPCGMLEAVGLIDDHLPSGCQQRLQRSPREQDRHSGVILAVEGVEGHVEAVADDLVLAHAADRPAGSPAVGIAGGHPEGAASAHAGAVEMDLPVIDAPVGAHVIDGIEDIGFGEVVIPAAAGAAEDVQFEIVGIALQAAGILEMIAAVAVHDDHQRPGAVGIVSGRDGELEGLAGIINTGEVSPLLHPAQGIQQGGIGPDPVQPLTQPVARLQGPFAFVTLPLLCIADHIVQVADPAVVAGQPRVGEEGSDLPGELLLQLLRPADAEALVNGEKPAIEVPGMSADAVKAVGQGGGEGGIQGKAEAGGGLVADVEELNRGGNHPALVLLWAHLRLEFGCGSGGGVRYPQLQRRAQNHVIDEKSDVVQGVAEDQAQAARRRAFGDEESLDQAGPDEFVAVGAADEKLLLLTGLLPGQEEIDLTPSRLGIAKPDAGLIAVPRLQECCDIAGDPSPRAQRRHRQGLFSGVAGAGMDLHPARIHPRPAAERAGLKSGVRQEVDLLGHGLKQDGHDRKN